MKVIVLFAILLAACTSQSVAQRDEPDVVGTRTCADALTIGYGRTVTLGDGLRVTFMRVVSDSRCPSGVTCIQKGDVVVELGFLRQGESRSVRLSGDPPGNEADVFDHHVELLKVSVATHPPAAPEKYSAKICVNRPRASR